MQQGSCTQRIHQIQLWSVDGTVAKWGASDVAKNVRRRTDGQLKKYSLEVIGWRIKDEDEDEATRSTPAPFCAGRFMGDGRSLHGEADVDMTDNKGN